VFADADRRNDKRESGAAEVERVPLDSRQTTSAVRINPRIGKAYSERQADTHTFVVTPVANEAA
jgi:hypothetical protein